MRDTLFKGKRKDNGEWVNGYFLRGWGSTYIVLNGNNPITEPLDAREVEADTTCMRTDLNDIIGKPIWENDIVKCGDLIGVVKIGKYEDGSRVDFGVYIKFTKENGYLIKNLNYWHEKIIVIGNAFDNPELIQEGSR